MKKKYFFLFAVFVLFVIIMSLTLRDGAIPIGEPEVYVNGDIGYEPVSDNNGMVLKAVTGIRLKADAIIQEFEIPNSSSNKYAISAFIILGDGTIIYESGFLYPGEIVEEIELYKSLDKGTYKNSILLYKFYTVDEPHTFISQCEFPIEIKCF